MAVKENITLRNSTKIVATIGPASSAKSVMQEMLRAGMDIARINFSHGGAETNLELISNLRAAAKAEGRLVSIMQDLQGPKLRVGEFPDGNTELLEDSIRTLKTGMVVSDRDIIPVPNERLHEELKRGDSILLNDGLIELEIMGVQGNSISAKVLLGGVLSSNQGISVPTRGLSMESLTDKDRSDLALGIKHGVDWVALSFVREADDVRKLKDTIEDLVPEDTEVPGVIVKIEKEEAVENFDEILKETDAVMVARGDLGLETSLSRVPVTQKMLIAKCLVAGKPVITATQMLSSMTLRPRPTRAEASDVANAVIDHTDCVMLSEETATGRYPVRSVETMSDIIARTEETPLDNLAPDQESRETVPLATAGAAVLVARQVESPLILVTTQTGYSARAVARFRPNIPIFAATGHDQVARQLLLSWGVHPILFDLTVDPEEIINTALEQLREQWKLSKGDHVVVVAGLQRQKGGFDSAVRVLEV